MVKTGFLRANPVNATHMLMKPYRVEREGRRSHIETLYNRGRACRSLALTVARLHPCDRVCVHVCVCVCL